uniref:Phytanoyl-CoA dioxygenase n=1 Tax=Alexandrium catenella TaxID=2925 RepID=A0A7S1L8Q6_ALECA|mmetsp:Transcript_10823/g.29446  ORF Transcript_10823/g.29446 Transcript_10823/m.29446 type:complete len:342 (+) Transcript_10823:70-1095(+)
MAYPAGVPAELQEKLQLLQKQEGDAEKSKPSVQPYEVSPLLRDTIDELDMWGNLREIQEKGYTVLTNVAPPEFIEDFCAAVRRVGSGQNKLHLDPTFVDAACNRKVYALAEFMCGQRPLLSQFAMSIKEQGKPGDPLLPPMHSDQFWVPTPFPEHNQLLTCCWALDGEFTAESGATHVVPGSHRLRRHPTKHEIKHDRELLQPTSGPRGCVVCWDGSVWHSGGVRLIPGQRVVAHVTYSRIGMRPLESYVGFMPKETISANPRLASLLGHTLDNFFENTPTRPFQFLKFEQLKRISQSTYDKAGFKKELADYAKEFLKNNPSAIKTFMKENMRKAQERSKL